MPRACTIIKKTVVKYPIQLILFGYLISALFKLNEIPGEWFGDISILHEYVSRIIDGHWPWGFSLSAGPFYHYLVAPLILVIGQNYIHYKIASVLVGGLGVYFTYLSAKKLAGQKIALLTALISSISFWTIVWARVGNSQIAIPLLVSATIFFAEKFTKNNDLRYLLAGVFFSSMGLFTYPQTFVLPLLLLLWLVFKKKYKMAVFCVLAFLPATLIIFRVYNIQKDNFSTGYVGSKVPKVQQFLQVDTYKKMGIRVVRTLGMFHFKGEEGFRTNVSNTTHIDIISSVFLMVGLYYWLKKDKKMLLLMIITFFIIIIPSCSPSIYLRETPNNGRTIGVIPFVYLFIASGIYFFYKKISNKGTKKVFLICTIAAIASLNLYKYFVLYPRNLPNRNVAFGKIISDYIDFLPKDTKLGLTSCCWGEWGQPEPKAIYYDLKNKEGRENIIDGRFANNVCDPQERNVVYIFNPNDKTTIDIYQKCFPGEKIVTYSEGGWNVFTAMYIK